MPDLKWQNGNLGNVKRLDQHTDVAKHKDDL